jgi:hypothetical protein
MFFISRNAELSEYLPSNVSTSLLQMTPPLISVVLPEGDNCTLARGSPFDCAHILIDVMAQIFDL